MRRPSPAPTSEPSVCLVPTRSAASAAAPAASAAPASGVLLTSSLVVCLTGTLAGCPAGSRGGVPAVLTYAPPACPLTYGYTLRVGSSRGEGAELAGAGASRALTVTGEIIVTAAAGGGLHLALGMPSDPTYDSASGAEIVLELAEEGRALTPAAGPLPELWERFGAFAGLAILWPPLPAAATPGATRPWSFTLPPAGPSGAPRPVEATVTFGAWEKTARGPQATLTMAWERTSATDATAMDRRRLGIAATSVKDIDLQSQASGHGSYRLTADGRLLHAALEAEQEVAMSFGGGQNAPPILVHWAAEVELVAACDLPAR